MSDITITLMPDITITDRVSILDGRIIDFNPALHEVYYRGCWIQPNTEYSGTYANFITIDGSTIWKIQIVEWDNEDAGEWGEYEEIDQELFNVFTNPELTAPVANLIQQFQNNEIISRNLSDESPINPGQRHQNV